MGLREYKAKRDFSRTREPKGRVAKSSSSVLHFVVQKHDASRLHYDFRLEMEGVLKSWAVPKGFPTRKGDRRLAVEVEDHPSDYGGFEGIIPKGNYGAGTVMLWDRGTYQVSGDDPPNALKSGKLHLYLAGKKLKGEWTLIRMNRFEGNQPQWLLLKSDQDVPEFSKRAESTSVLSGRTMEQIAGDRDRSWQSKEHEHSPPAPDLVEAAKPANKSGRTKNPNHSGSVPDLPSGAAEFVEPMKARLTDKLPAGPDWVYEVKFDGIRALAVRNGAEIRLFSRAGNDLTGRFSGIVGALKKIPERVFLLDGEIVALDHEGRSSFQLLQSWHRAGGRRPLLCYYAFDVLVTRGKNARALPLTRRKELAQALVTKAADEVIRFSPALRGDPSQIEREAKARGLEGLIAKKQDSPYFPGQRSSDWLKFKWVAEQEFVIGGYTQPKGGRQRFGALLVGYYEDGKLLFAAKVGTGFSETSLRELHSRFQPMITPQCPFANLPEKSSAGSGGGLTAGQMRLCTWLSPRLVCQVKFSEWTRDGHLRQPAFIGLREDKDPKHVIRERSGA